MLDAEQLDFFQKKLKNMLFGYNMGEGREQRLEAYLFELQKRYKYLDIATVAAVIQNIPTHHRDFPPTAGQFGDALESLQTRKNKDAETAHIKKQKQRPRLPQPLLACMRWQGFFNFGRWRKWYAKTK